MFNIFKKEKEIEPVVTIFIGRSGCGKGTQVELYVKKLQEINSSKILHVETGSLLREYVKNISYTAKMTKEVIESGGLMPESIVIGLWANYIMNNFTGNENIIFDGAPRKLLESEVLDNALKFYKISKYKVIYMNVGREWATNRLLVRGRVDDIKEDIDRRMEWFEKDVMPSIEFFKNNENCEFIEINGEQTIEQVHDEVVRKVFKN
jgi:adenylate kinase